MVDYSKFDTVGDSDEDEEFAVRKAPPHQRPSQQRFQKKSNRTTKAPEFSANIVTANIEASSPEINPLAGGQSKPTKKKHIHTLFCAGCGREQRVDENKFKRCNKCKMVKYCSRECQVKHWKGGHKSDCSTPTPSSADNRNDPSSPPLTACADHQKQSSTVNKDYLLQEACREGDHAKFKELLAGGAKLNHCLELFGVTSLFMAVHGGNEDIVTDILAGKDDNGCDVNAVDGNGYTCLMQAVAAGLNPHTIVDILVKGGAQVNYAHPRSNSSALVMAAEAGLLDVVEMLLAAGADINHCDVEGKSALLLAISRGHVDVALRLVELGADVTIEAMGINVMQGATMYTSRYPDLQRLVVRLLRSEEEGIITRSC